jgi:1-acyl-sn-glycerol-3-phosphate acyltransferase
MAQGMEMNDIYRERTEEVGSYLDVDVLRPIRIVTRLMGMVTWILFGLTAMTGAASLGLVSSRLARHARRWVSRTWVKGVPRVLGTRIIVRGTPPKAPFFLVGNHISWIDFFVTHNVVDALTVTESEIGDIPFARFLFSGLDLIIVDRVNDELIRINQRIKDTIHRGRNIVMAPEATVTPGLRVCHFHSGLLEPVASAGLPVHYASLTVRTPAGERPASEVVLCPDPKFVRRDRTPIEAEIERRAMARGFLPYLLGLIGLPWHEYTITFAKEPVTAPDRKTLAKELQRSVQSIFTPVA